MVTFLQSRRRRLRAFLGRPWARRGTEASGFCSECQAISAKLEEFFDCPDGLSVYPGIRRVIDKRKGDLEHVVKLSRRKRCSLCNFLAHMVEAYGDAASQVDLFIGSAKRHYGLPQNFSQIPESLILWIWPSHRNGDIVPLFPYGDKDNESAGAALELSNDPGKISGHYVGPQADLELVRSWFDDCAMHHGNTCQIDTSILQDIPGFRVIDCSSRTLVYWSQIPKTMDRDYVALSYVWGTEADDENEAKNFWLTWIKNGLLGTPGQSKANSDWTTDQRLPSKLPRLIEDAIIAVIKLGFKYLWVDRYCIPQDNSEAKHTQIQSMDRIYGSACLTIIAAAGDDPSYGLAGVSPRSGRFQASLSTSVRIGSRTIVTVGTDNFAKELKGSKWNSRAWTMQEGFLSCRCLVFSEYGAYFQCSSPRSYRFEAIHEPPALLQFKHEVLSREQHSSTVLPDSIILTKVGRAGDFKFGWNGCTWCLQLVKEYFPRSMTFEADSLNAFSGILKHLQSLKPPIHNLWGVLMLPDVTSTVSGERIGYNLVCGLAWSYERDRLFFLNGFGKLEQPTILPRKEMFPSWTWADWRPRTALDGEDFTSRHHLELHNQRSAITSLVELSVELDDGRIVSWGQGYESDVLWLTTLPKPPRILHIHGYTSNPQLRCMTEEDWVEFHERTIIPTAEDLSEDDHTSQDHSSSRDLDWVLIDADGEHLQLPFEWNQFRKPWCCSKLSGWWNLSTDAYHLQRQRRYQTETIKSYTESTFDFRIILLGYKEWEVYYMVLMKVPGTDGHVETFERVNVINEYEALETAQREEFLAKLTGKHAESFPGTPWVKMSTRIA